MATRGNHSWRECPVVKSFIVMLGLDFLFFVAGITTKNRIFLIIKLSYTFIVIMIVLDIPNSIGIL